MRAANLQSTSSLLLALSCSCSLLSALMRAARNLTASTRPLMTAQLTGVKPMASQSCGSAPSSSSTSRQDTCPIIADSASPVLPSFVFAFGFAWLARSNLRHSACPDTAAACKACSPCLFLPCTSTSSSISSRITSVLPSRADAYKLSKDAACLEGGRGNGNGGGRGGRCAAGDSRSGAFMLSCSPPCSPPRCLALVLHARGESPPSSS
mmetsp:Transcript_17757/g.58424  ORF Transcript_17757/g.58424 Transcript_17757/m.58424 type:complete len:209 (-) Transcript_17757:241-867(-)